MTQKLDDLIKLQGQINKMERLRSETDNLDMHQYYTRQIRHYKAQYTKMKLGTMTQEEIRKYNDEGVI